MFCIALVGWLQSSPVPLIAGTPAESFDAANRLYEQGKFAEAAASYELLLAGGTESAAIHFNLGNTSHKLGRMGPAIWHYRAAERLAPRDPEVRANLEFARRSLGAAGEPQSWRRWFLSFPPGRLFPVGLVGFTLWFTALALGELSSGLRTALFWPRRLLAGAVLAVALAWAASTWMQSARPEGVVLREAELRFGPFADAKVAQRLADGSELDILDERPGWRQVRTRNQQIGWVKETDAKLLP